MLVNNLGVLKTPRTIRCMKIEESDKFIRQQKQAARKLVLSLYDWDETMDSTRDGPSDGTRVETWDYEKISGFRITDRVWLLG